MYSRENDVCVVKTTLTAAAVAKPARRFGHALQISIIIIIHFFRNWFLIWSKNTEKFAFARPSVGLASALHGVNRPFEPTPLGILAKNAAWPRSSIGNDYVKKFLGGCLIVVTKVLCSILQWPNMWNCFYCKSMKILCFILTKLIRLCTMSSKKSTKQRWCISPLS